MKIKQSFRKNKQLNNTLILLGIGCVYILFLISLKPFSGLNDTISDLLFTSENPSPNIVIVGIDDETLETFGAWADWSRTIHAQAIENLKNANAHVIGIDILFTDNSNADHELAAAIEHAGNVVLPLIGVEGLHRYTAMPSFNRILMPVPELTMNAMDIGHANIIPDNDGTVRNLPMFISDGNNQVYPAFSLVILHNLFSIPLPSEYHIEDGKLHLLERNIPVDTDYNFRINFSPEDKDRSYISYKDVIDSNFDPSIVENKIVLIGMTATGQSDKWNVPGEKETVPGVFIHANVIDNILNQRYVVEIGTGINILIMFLLLGIMGLLLPLLGLLRGAVMASIMFVGYLLSVFLSFENGYILNILYPLSIFPFSYGGSVIIQNVRNLIENAHLKQEVLDGYTGTIKALAAAIDAKDHYTQGHSQRVTEYTLLGGMHLDISPAERKLLEYAAILHDVGKIGIPENILTKPGSLDKDEWECIRKHPEIGASIIESVPFLEKVKSLVLHHHERYDGNGYPHGLSGEDIPLGARLIAVADTFDSMTSDRAYRSAMSIDKAISEIKKSTGTQLCPVAVEAFLEGLKSYIEQSHLIK